MTDKVEDSIEAHFVPTDEGILKYPHKCLMTVSEPVQEEHFGTEYLKALVQHMQQTMAAKRGLGLAANQVGVLKRIFVARGPFEDKITTYINPVITEKSDEEFNFKEGCLSVPGVYATVRRPKTITVEYQDLDGKKHTQTVSQLHATILQHEIDHLDGIEFIDKISKLTTMKVKQKLKAEIKKDKREYARDGYPFQKEIIAFKMNLIDYL